MPIYDITIKIDHKESFLIEAANMDDATTKALELAIKNNPGSDVWLDGFAEQK